MKKHLVLLLIMWSALYRLVAQPIPCEEPPTMTSFCADACIICDIDGFTGRHESDIVGEAPPDFCTFFVHNAQWIAFIAGSTDLVVSLSVSNCDLDVGLELALYQSDCQNHELISNCFGGTTGVIAPGNSGTITNTVVPLVIGEYYYLVMDGAAGDNCDWTFTVVEGSTAVNPLSTSGNIQGDFTSCPGVSRSYFVDSIAGASNYEWTLDGAVIANDDLQIDIDWTMDGSYELCVTASNACDEAPSSCETIIISSIPESSINAFICDGDEYQLNDTISLTDAGDYEFNFQSYEGCDSIVNLSLEVISESTTNLSFFICEGDSITIGGIPYYETGLYTQTLLNYQGCDSTVNLALDLIICEIQGTSSAEAVVCFGESSGSIDFSVSNGTPPLDYTWQNLSGSLSGAGTISGLNEVQSINNLPEGSYWIYINDNFGNDAVLVQTVNQPDLLTNEWDISSFNDYNVSCYGEDDGSLEIIAIGGVAPYTYQWDNGAQTSTLSNLFTGDYTVTITDNYGCSLVAMNTLLEPSALSFEVNFNDPSCEGFETGFIEILSASGGVAPYQFSYGTSTFTENTIAENLSAGSYTVVMQDQEACSIDTTASITAKIIPIIDLGEDININLGESTNLNISSSVPLDSLRWFSSGQLSCDDCPEPVVTPYVNTQYVAAVSSIDGCTVLDSVWVLVEERRRVYIPNAFSPNFDGTNDYLLIYGGEEVARIISFQIFSRWGEQVYGRENFPANDVNFAWDGRFNGKDAPTGVYIWYAEIEYLDGQRAQLEGDLTIVR